MTYTNNNNNLTQSQVPDSYWETPRRVTMVRFTKTKQSRDGNGIQRGALIRDDRGQERWVSEHPSNAIFNLPWNSSIYFNGIGNRPSLTMTQADSYSRMTEPKQYSNNANTLYDSIANSKYSQNEQSELDYDNYQPQPNSDNNTINETLLENVSVLLSNAINLASSLNPQLSEESIVKLAISASISYQQKIKDMPF